MEKSVLFLMIAPAIAAVMVVVGVRTKRDITLFGGLVLLLISLCVAIYLS